MAETKDAPKAKAAKEPSVEDRVAALEAAVGLGTAAPEEAENAVPGEPLKPHELYAPPTEEELKEEAKAQEAATKAAEKE